MRSRSALLFVGTLLVLAGCGGDSPSDPDSNGIPDIVGRWESTEVFTRDDGAVTGPVSFTVFTIGDPNDLEGRLGVGDWSTTVHQGAIAGRDLSLADWGSQVVISARLSSDGQTLTGTVNLDVTDLVDGEFVHWRSSQAPVTFSRPETF